mgnify:CR=1 FL=1
MSARKLKAPTALVATFLLCHFVCYGQERTLSFINNDDPHEVWTCPLPVEATVRTKDKKKIFYAIIGANDSGLVALNLVYSADTAVQDPAGWRKEYLALLNEQAAIDSDRSLSREEKQRRILQRSIGLIFRDTTQIILADIKKVDFNYSDKSKWQRTVPMGIYLTSSLVFMVGMIELLVSSDPEVEDNMEAPYPAVLFFAGLGGVVASGMWTYRSYHKIIRPNKWRLQRE